MGKKSREIQKNIKGIGELDYVEVRNVPMTVDAEFGNLIAASVIRQLERLVAQRLITERISLRGVEVAFLRGIFAMSQRQFAEKLGLSHVAVFKWEDAKNKRLDVVNEVAVKVLVAGLLGLKIPASIEVFVGRGDAAPKKLIIDFAATPARQRRKSA